MKVLSIVGARPQFIKLSAVSRALRRRHTEVIVNTGQHYDFLMAGVFLRDLAIPRPDHELECGSGTHAEQTARMLVGIDDVIVKENPDAVVVFGDTNSTLAGALAAAKRNVPVAHIEAGLRSHNRSMPEEINRVVTDHVSTFLFCPTPSAVENLRGEGITSGVHCVGDVMYDAVLHYGSRADDAVLGRLGVRSGEYVLATIHRAANTDDEASLRTIVTAFGDLREPVIFPVHPRTREAMAQAGIALAPNVRAVEPLSYLEMLAAEKHARSIVTDSGGVQKEAYWLGVPCVTVRTETEWTELVGTGWNTVAGVDAAKIVSAVRAPRPAATRPELFGDGHAAERIADALALKGDR